jgi:uncharacterized membrane protein YesL
MSFFGLFNYSKAGPGVSKNEPQKKAFFSFLDLYFRKFWLLIKLNLLYSISLFILSIPFLFILIPCLMSKVSPFSIVFFISLLPLAFTGPLTAGFTYVLRNYVREEHVYLWSDYIETAKKNWKQGTVVALINVFAFSIFAIIIPFYSNAGNLTTAMGIFSVLLFSFSFLFLIVYVFMQFYIYVILITFDLKLKQIYKNAMLFAFLSFWRNILTTVFLGLIIAVFAVVPVAYFLIPIIGFSTMGLIINFNVWPVIKKYMIDANPENVVEPIEQKSLFEDKGKTIK